MIEPEMNRRQRRLLERGIMPSQGVGAVFTPH